MSRVANMPVNIPEKVEVVISQDNVQVKGPLGELNQSLTGDVKINKEDNVLTFQVNNESKFAKSMSGTLRALVNNMVTGVSAGFEKKLTLIFSQKYYSSNLFLSDLLLFRFMGSDKIISIVSFRFAETNT